MRVTRYETPRWVVALLIKLTLVLGALAIVTTLVVSFGAAGLRSGPGGIAVFIGLLYAGTIAVGTGVTYALLHGILAVFDIADNTAQNGHLVKAG
jgi:hypothetical protein